MKQLHWCFCYFFSLNINLLSFFLVQSITVVISHWRVNLFSENYCAEWIQCGFEGKNRSPSEREGTLCSLHGNIWEGPLKFRLIHVHKLVRRALYECIEKVSVRKNKCSTNHAAIDAFRTRKVWLTPSWKEGYLMPECDLITPLLQGEGPMCRFCRQDCFLYNTWRTRDLWSDCEYLFIRYSCQSLHIRKTRETIHQRWIPQKNLERCVRVNVS